MSKRLTTIDHGLLTGAAQISGLYDSLLKKQPQQLICLPRIWRFKDSSASWEVMGKATWCHSDIALSLRLANASFGKAESRWRWQKSQSQFSQDDQVSRKAKCEPAACEETVTLWKILRLADEPRRFVNDQLVPRTDIVSFECLQFFGGNGRGLDQTPDSFIKPQPRPGRYQAFRKRIEFMVAGGNSHISCFIHFELNCHGSIQQLPVHPFDPETI
ncbi:MAG: hypothetical protein ACREIA_00910 [Opitutaceae bacterium]